MEALQTCEELERRLDELTGPRKPSLQWRAGWLRTRAYLAAGRTLAAMDAFRSVYAAFHPDDEEMIGQMLARVPDLIAAGAPERTLVEILSSDRDKSAGLLPLVIALRQRTGEPVRAPIEAIEVAADIREGIETRVGSSAAPG